MKTKLIPIIQKREQNIFKRTQRRLTFGFVGQLMLFLFLFILIMFVVLYLVIMQDQEREIHTLASQEAERYEKFLLRNIQRPLEEREHELELRGSSQFFSYVVNTDGDLILGKEAFPQLRPELLSKVLNEDSEDKEVYQAKVNVDLSSINEDHDDFEKDDDELHLELNRKDIHLMIAKEQISFEGQAIGTLYIGKDISFAFQLFTWLLAVLLGLMVLFFGIAFFISNRMSRKAMVPISAAFDRQRQFVADASHELRTPLSVMLSSIDAVEMTIDEEKKDGMVNKLLFNMKDEVKRMTNLVSDLLVLARSDSGKVERHDDVFDFTASAKKVMDSVLPLAGEKKIGLHFEAPESIIGQGDQQRLTQLLYILVDNALKYTPNGGKVGLTLSRNSKELTIEVWDTGIGIRPEEQQLIFERFYRADEARSRQLGSYGLGLSIAKWIVDIHNGTIEVKSDVSKGSKFIVKIPFYIKN